MGFGFDFGAMLNRKYDILGEHANAAQTSADAGVLQALAANTSANAHAGLEGAQAGVVGGNAAAEQNLEGAQTDYYNQQSKTSAYNRTHIPWNFAKGTANVPNRPATDNEILALHQHLTGGGAPGRGMVAMTPKGSDIVPSMLTPGEAVLNTPTAEMIGRDKIAAANAIGNLIAKMGTQGSPPAGKSAQPKGKTPAKGKASPGKPQDHCAGTSRVQGYAKGTDRVEPKPQDFSGGTHMVGHGKSAKTPTIDPAALMSLLGAMHGGGGMVPPGGGAQPMGPGPQPM